MYGPPSSGWEPALSTEQKGIKERTKRTKGDYSEVVSRMIRQYSPFTDVLCSRLHGGTSKH